MNRITLPIDRLAWLVLWMSLLAAPQALGCQQDEMKLINRVAELQQQLEAGGEAQREAAEKELIALGAGVLDHLEPVTESTPSEAVERINRVRLALEKLVVESVTQPSQVTLEKKLSVRMAIREIVKQSGNQVIGDGLGDDLLNTEIELKLKDATFWQALEAVMQQADLSVNIYGGEAQQLQLAPNGLAAVADPNQDLVIPQDNQSIFQTTVQQIVSSRNLRQPNLNYCDIQVVVRWEPRITPITVALPLKSLKLVDEFDQPIPVTNPDRVFESSVQDGIPELEFGIPIGLLDRQIESIKSLEGEFQAILPGRVEKFRFRKVGRLPANALQAKAGVSVQLKGIRANEDLHEVILKMSFDGGKSALESHLSWVYENQVMLVNEQGEEFTPLAYESAGQTENSISIKYLFDQDPAPLDLVYETPAAIVEIPVKFRLKGIPLP